MNNKEKGRIGEDYAVKVFKKNNFKILLRNFFNHTGKAFGEIDFVARKGNSLHFVEVKTRSSFKFGNVLEAIGKYKKRRIIKAAQYFMLNFKELQACQLQFDLVEVILDPIDKNVEKIKIYSDVIDDYAS